LGAARRIEEELDCRREQHQADLWIHGGPELMDHSTSHALEQRVGVKPGRTALTLLLAMLATTTILSQFFRASTSVIGPELIRDLSLAPEVLGFANGSFFLAVFLAQIPVGLAFDRFGPRFTVGALSVLMVLGATLHALSLSGADLVLARFVVGLGCAGSFMGAVVLVSRWYEKASWSMALSWVFALSQIGLLLAGLPLAAASQIIGWRAAFLVMALIAGTLGLLFVLFVRDEPPASATKKRPGAPKVAAFAGLKQVFATPGLMRVLGLFVVAYASVATVIVLWAGPYLNDVHGLGPVRRGQVLLAMASIQTLGGLALGPLDRLFNTRKWVVVAAASSTLSALIALAAAPDMHLPVALAVLLLMSGSSAYGMVLLAHIRSHFPDHLAGRGTTTANMAQLAGAVLLPAITGFMPKLFPGDDSGYSVTAYRWIFATLAACLALGLVVYLTARDTKPHQT
jgi:MFS family permease